MKGIRVIDRATCNALIRLLDRIYRMGVMDAYKVNDEGECADFIERTKEPGVYGRVIDGHTMDCNEWQLTLIVEARKQVMHGAMYRYFNRTKIYGQNYLSVLLPIAQDFYNKGMQDYNANPNATSLAIFNDTKRVWWNKKLKSVSTHEYIEQIQLFCFARKHSDEGFGAKKALKKGYYDIFAKVMNACIIRREEWYD